MSSESVPLSGRRAEAVRNNTRILESAKAVFVANPAAPDDQGDPWAAFVTFMERIAEADTLALAVKLAGPVTPTEELYRESQRGQQLNQQLIERSKAAGALREDIDVNDMTFIFEQLS